MAIIKANPTSPGRRFVVKVVTPGLHKGEPVAPTFRDALETQRVCDAILKSASSQQWVDV